MNPNDNDITKSVAPAGLLSNGHMHVMVSSDGIGVAKREWIALTRWRPDPVENVCGLFIYLKDADSGAMWSVGVQPSGKIGGYTAASAPGRFTIRHVYSDIEATLDITVAPSQDLEVRRLILRDLSGKPRRIVVTSYAEVALNHPDADLAHPAFSKLFVQTEAMPDQRLLIAKRRPRSKGETWPMMFHGILGGEHLSWETDRLKFLGRGRGPGRPAALQGGSLSGTTGNVLDPVFSLQATANVAPSSSATIAFFLGADDDPASASQSASRIGDLGEIDAIFDAAADKERSLLRSLDIGEEEAVVVRALGAAIIRGDASIRARRSVPDAAIDLNAIFAHYGITRDVPLVVATHDWAHPVTEFLSRALQYWSAKGLDVRPLVLSSARQPKVPRASDRAIVLDPADVPSSDLDAILTTAHWVTGDELPTLATDAVGPGLKPGGDDAPNSPDGAPITNGADLLFWNGYGGFTSDGSEYVIRMPWRNGDLNRPPLPWINVVSNESSGFLVSESGAGYTWCRNSQANRLTPWSNDPVSDPHGEAIYVRDHEDGSFWSPTPGPAPAPANYEARHGFGYSTFHLTHRDMVHETTMFVPRQRPLKCVRLRITNHAAKRRRLSVFSYQRLVMGFVPSSSPAIITKIAAETGMLTAVNATATDFRGGVAFSSASAFGCHLLARHATCDRLAFMGQPGTTARPFALTSGAPLNEGSGAGLDPCFAHQLQIEIDPGRTAECIFVIGEATDDTPPSDLRKSCEDPAVTEAALQEVMAFWRTFTNAIQVKTPSPAMDLMLNGWLLYQNLSCRIWGRSAFYQSGGAFGYRDQLQDTSSLAAIRPDLTRAQILLHARHQFPEGDVLHWWHPEPMAAGLRTGFSDDLLWLPFVTAHYLKTTGDASVLDEQLPFVTAPVLGPGQDEVFLKPEICDETATVYEHCVRAIDRSLTVGAHGLPLMGTGDWNDGMNRVGREGRGESVWLGFFLCHVLEEFLPVCNKRSDSRRVAAYRDYRDRLIRALNDGGWDGAWYRRAYYDDGSPLGSRENSECRIDALAQAWAVISGVAPKDRAAMAMDSLQRELVSKEHGIIRLLTPPFATTEKDPGYIKGYVAGVRENGGQYTHAACWVIRAFADLGRRDCAASLLEMILPVTHSNSPEAAGIYKVEPYVVAADIYDGEPHTGRGGWTWYTGSAGWMFRVALESILGFHISEGNRLTMEPRIPDGWPSYQIDYTSPTGAKIRIAVENPARDARRIVAAEFNGRPVAPDAIPTGIPLPNDGSHHIRIVLGGP